MPEAVIFDVDGTLVDSVDLHASAWQEALLKFGHDVTFAQARQQIGKGGDQLIPVFLSAAEQKDHGEDMEEWRGKLFKAKYLPMVKPFSAVPELLGRVRRAGLRIAIASSSKADDLETLLDIAHIRNLVDATTSSEEAAHSKPAPHLFEIALRKLKLLGHQVVAVGDTPYDAEAAGKAEIAPIGVLCGGFGENELRTAGCESIYWGPSALLADFDASPLANGKARQV